VSTKRVVRKFREDSCTSDSEWGGGSIGLAPALDLLKEILAGVADFIVIYYYYLFAIKHT